MRRHLPLAALTGLLLLTACSGGGGGTSKTAALPGDTPSPSGVGASATPDASTSPSAAASASASASAVGAGCASGGVPAGAVSRPTIDVDGDGRPDTLWLSSKQGVRRTGITTAAGTTFGTTVRSASPVAASVLAARPAPGGPVDLLVDDGRSVQVLVVAGCSVQQLLNPQGTPYVFDLGNRYGTGTGVGCLGPAGAGLTGLQANGTDGTSYSIKRTSVVQQANRAHNGAMDTLRATQSRDAKLIASAQTVTCGDQTIERDGVHEPQS
jgi:hypothetical protein